MMMLFAQFVCAYRISEKSVSKCEKRKKNGQTFKFNVNEINFVFWMFLIRLP